MIQSNPETTADIEAVAEVLRATSIGEIATYQQMSNAIGRSIIANRHIIYSARKMVEEETGTLFAVVRETGFKRLSNEESPIVGAGAIRHIRRTARTNMKRLANVSTSNLDPDTGRKVLAQRAQLGALAIGADNRKTQAIMKAADRDSVLPAGRVLEIFTRK